MNEESSGRRSRVGWGAADQVVVGLSNFLLNLLAARYLGIKEFGTFAIIYVGFTLILGISRSLVSEPLTVQYAAVSRHVIAATGRASGAACIFGVCTGLTLAIIGNLHGNTIGNGVLALGCFLPMLLLQDCWRFGLFAAGRPKSALWNDSVFLAIECVAVAIAMWHAPIQVYSLVAAWGVAATVTSIMGSLQLGVRPHLGACRHWIASHRETNGRYLAEFVMISGANQLSLWTVGGLGGVRELAVLRAAQIAFGPVNTAFLGFEVAIVPEAVRTYRDNPKELPRLMVLISVACGLIAATWAVLLFLVPVRLGRAMLGDLWVPARDILPVFGVINVVFGLSLGAAHGLRAKGMAQRTVRVRALLASGTVLFCTAGALLGGAYGAALGLAVVYSAGLVVWWRQARRN